jgi:Fungalysin/Thermolysin Propeptide Motif
MVVSSKSLSGDTGTTSVYFQQVHKGIGVYAGLLTVNVARDGG